jgi:D-alanyl-D-alanine carboxypeptidase
VGYKVLGLVLEAVTGKPYGELVQERILSPLGMNATVPWITNEMRHRLAVGYNDGPGDRPWRPEYGFVPAPWLETNTGDGCICSTAADLAIYLRMLLNRGVGPNGRVLSEESFALMTTPYSELSSEEPFGYGINLTPNDGRPRIGHTGGMVGFISMMLGDVDSGIGVVVFKNSMQATYPIAAFALSCVINALAEEPLPELPEPPAVDLSPYPGQYRDGDEVVTVSIEGGQLAVQRGAEKLMLDPLGIPPEKDRFLARETGWNLFPFWFLRNDAEEIEGLVHGEKWFPAASYSGPTAFDVPEEWQAYPGHYRSYNPWNPEFRVVLRQGALRLIYPSGWESLLTPDGDGFRVDDDPEGPERFVFDTIVDGKAQRVGSPGSETYYRFFTP